MKYIFVLWKLLLDYMNERNQIYFSNEIYIKILNRVINYLMRLFGVSLIYLVYYKIWLDKYESFNNLEKNKYDVINLKGENI